MSRKPEFELSYVPAGYDPAKRPFVFEGTQWSGEWEQIGQHLWEGRKRLQISMREAAKRAGISEALWRQLEGAGKVVEGQLVKPNPRPENLYRALKAVGEDPSGAFALLHWSIPEDLSENGLHDRLEAKLARLSSRDRKIIEAQVDSMLSLSDD